MTLQWLGHSCFRVSAGGYAIVLDPYANGSVDGLRPLSVSANAVLCSHAHGDHGAKEVVTLVQPDAPSPFTITAIDSVHDDAGGTLRGPNTIHVLEAEGVRIAHLGDLGTMLTDAQLAAIGPVDALLIPVGGYYTIDAKTAKAVADAVNPRIIVPMHYRSDAFGFDVLSTLDAFTSLYDVVEYLDTDTIDLRPDMPRGVMVPRYL